VLADDGAVAYETQVLIARSPLMIKGYGPIKEAAVARWREQVVELRRPTVGAPT
jgi:indolepyruvate ferredoxin oxidoreductase